MRTILERMRFATLPIRFEVVIGDLKIPTSGKRILDYQPINLVRTSPKRHAFMKLTRKRAISGKITRRNAPSTIAIQNGVTPLNIVISGTSLATPATI